jgi:uncharacterized protein YraI
MEQAVVMASGLERTTDRRGALRLLLGAGAMAAAGGASLALGRQAAARSGDGQLRTTTALNLRAKPSLQAKVLLVMPKGAIVTNQYAEKNGFIKVGYQGTIGWAYGTYLEPAGSGDPPIIGQAITTTAVNFRSGPSTSESVFRVLSKGTTVEISNLVQNGFRYAIHNGQAGWIYDQYLAPAGGEGPAIFTTTTAVNLRAKPSTSAAILLVVPAGAVVKDYDLELVNGFRSVDFKGTVGWIYNAYLE